jgi:hypothetical protein
MRVSVTRLCRRSSERDRECTHYIRPCFTLDPDRAMVADQDGHDPPGRPPGTRSAAHDSAAPSDPAGHFATRQETEPQAESPAAAQQQHAIDFAPSPLATTHLATTHPATMASATSPLATTHAHPLPEGTDATSSPPATLPPAMTHPATAPLATTPHADSKPSEPAPSRPDSACTPHPTSTDTPTSASDHALDYAQLPPRTRSSARRARRERLNLPAH